MEDFSNNAISPEGIPEIQTLSFTPLEPEALKVRQINLGLLFSILTIGFAIPFITIRQWQNPWLITFMALCLFGCYALIWLNQLYSFRWSGYALREQDLLYRSGWLRRRQRVVPLTRIQHLSVVSGWLERRYGLASLRIYTAAHADFAISGLKEAQAIQLKAWISEQINQQDDTQSHEGNDQ